MLDDLVEVEICEDMNVKIIRESLSRCGISNRKTKTLYPSVYLYKEDDRYFLCHFKEIFAMRENGYEDMSDEDILRRNAIIYCLVNWGMVTLKDETMIDPHDKFVFVLPYKSKSEWTISHKIKYFMKD